MKILNFGSMNIDKVYGVDDFVQSQETISARSLETFCGGKGLNQSIALGRAGADVYHAGAMGEDGEDLLAMLQESGVDTRYLQTLSTVSGHAIIQLTPQGQNCIIVYGGANRALDVGQFTGVLKDFGPGDILLMQNETAGVAEMMAAGKAAGLKIVFNPSPAGPELMDLPLQLVDVFMLNEVEGAALTGEECGDWDEMLEGLLQRFPHAAFVLTIGKEGAIYRDSETVASHGIYDVPVVDTTGAGDTFCGYFLAALARDMPPGEALEYASLASSLAVSRKGAGPSIPKWGEVEAFRSEMQRVLK